MDTTVTYLNNVKKGDRFRIGKISSESLSIQLLRFGLTEGSIAECFEKIPLGPIILKYGNQQLAIGQEHSKVVSISKL